MAVFNGILYVISSGSLISWDGNQWTVPGQSPLCAPPLGTSVTGLDWNTLSVYETSLVLGGTFNYYDGASYYTDYCVLRVDENGGVTQLGNTSEAVEQPTYLASFNGTLYFTYQNDSVTSQIATFDAVENQWNTVSTLAGAYVWTLASVTTSSSTCGTILECLLVDPNVSAFVDLLQSTVYGTYWNEYSQQYESYSTLLGQPGYHHLFVPSNAAVATFLAQDPSPALISATLAYHIVPVLASPLDVGNSALVELLPTLLTNSGNFTSFVNLTNANWYGGQYAVYGAPMRRYDISSDSQVLRVTSTGSVAHVSNGVDSFTVTQPNVHCSNGYLHLVNAMLSIPQSPATVLANAGLTDFLQALNISGLLSTVATTGNLTILAPSNAAFAASLPLWRTMPVANLAAILSYHITTSAAYRSTDLVNGLTVTSLLGTSASSLQVSVHGSTVTVTGAQSSATIAVADIFTTSGVVHQINNILAPMPLDLLAAPPNSTSSLTSFLYLGGAFTGLGQLGYVNATDAGRWTGSAWLPLGTLSGATVGTTRVYAFAKFQSAVVVAGEFLTADGNSVGGLAAWNPSNSSYTPLSNSGVSVGSGVVYTTVVANGVLYFGGSFSSLNGNTAHSIAKWDGVTATPIGYQLANGPVFAIAMFQGALYAGGGFVQYTDNIIYNGVARWNGTWWVPLLNVFQAPWGSNSQAWGGTVRAFAEFKGLLYMSGDVYAGVGAASSVGLLAWNGTTPVAMPRIQTATGFVLYDSVFYVYGDFANVATYNSGTSTWTAVAAKRMAMTTDGYTWQPAPFNMGPAALSNGGGFWVPGYYPGPFWQGIASSTVFQGSLYITGSFATGGKPQFYTAVLNTSTSTFESVDYSTNGPVATLAAISAPLEIGCTSVLSYLSATATVSTFAALYTNTSYSALYNSAGNLSTLFVPTNAAFASASVAPSSMAAVLAYHILPNASVELDSQSVELPLTRLSAGAQLGSLNISGYTLLGAQVVGINGFTVGFGVPGIDVATVTTANVVCPDGVLHVVNRVFQPPADLYSMLVRAGYSDFALALNITGLYANISQLAGVTVFAPTNAAFATLGAYWSTTVPVAQLTAILQQTIVDGVVYSPNFPNVTLNGLKLTPLAGAQLVLDGAGSGYAVAQFNTSYGGNLPAAIVVSDILVANGVVHGIDQLIQPWSALFYQTLVTVTSVGSTDSNQISTTKDCVAMQTGTATVLGGWTVIYQGAPTCCVSRGLVTNGTLLSGCDHASVSSTGFVKVQGSSYGYTKCFSAPAPAQLPTQQILAAGKYVNSGPLDASSSLGNNPTSTKRTSTVRLPNVYEGAFRLTVSSSRRSTSTDTYCTGSGILEAGNSGGFDCVMNVCGQTTSNYVVIDLSSEAVGGKCYHTCYQ